MIREFATARGFKFAPESHGRAIAIEKLDKHTWRAGRVAGRSR